MRCLDQLGTGSEFHRHNAQTGKAVDEQRHVRAPGRHGAVVFSGALVNVVFHQVVEVQHLRELFLVGRLGLALSLVGQIVHALKGFAGIRPSRGSGLDKVPSKLLGRDIADSGHARFGEDCAHLLDTLLRQK